MIEESMKVTKQEAATQQLETAIKLFFENQSLISAHTLSGAAYGILEGIYKNNRTEILNRQLERSKAPSNVHSSWNEELSMRFKKEDQKEVFKYLNKTQNFFKHADKDHNDTCEFSREECANRIITTIRNYTLVFEKTTKAMNICYYWFIFLNPTMSKEGSSDLEIIATNPCCQNLAEDSATNQIVAGYESLKSQCPHLFAQP